MPETGPAQQFLTFRVERDLYALPAETVSEVIPMPAVARLPLGPSGLLGMANLRGAVVPVASLRALLARADGPLGQTTRAIVLAGEAPIAVAVDAMDGLVSVTSERISTRACECTAAETGHLRGTFETANAEVAKVLDVASLVAGAFVQRARPARKAPALHEALAPRGEVGIEAQSLVCFDVAGQVYALELDAVEEIAPAPMELVSTPHAETVLLGMTMFRGAVLPLLSLRGLLGFPLALAEHARWRQKMIVISVAGAKLGLVADRMLAILAAKQSAIDPLPSMVAARTGGEARIKAVYRGGEGVGLVSILAPGQLFREDVMQRLTEAPQTMQPHGKSADIAQESLQVLVFQLGDEEFALPIGAVDQVARAPATVTRIPRAPKFLEGVINLDGEVLPVVDQRRRFGLAEFQGERTRQRLIVVRSAQHRAGLIVDSVRDVLRVPADAVEPAPDLAGEAVRLVHGVINLQLRNRMVLLLDPAELLSRSERRLLDNFAAVARATR